ncbi:MAG: lytic transglycosylase domain-containing protein [Thermoanaerobaculia bacterium]
MRERLTAVAVAVAIAATTIPFFQTKTPAQAAPARIAIGSVDVPAPEPVANVADAPAWDLPNLDHARVDHWVNVFTTTKRDDFAIFLERMKTYEPMILDKLTTRNMPRDLIFLAMIESGFNPAARSGASAVGLWQFIADTGRRYGLTVTSKIDERKDPEKSTDAALEYLADLHARFGSWYLAAAAYNTGENRVGRIMRELTGSERGNEESYYEIADRLPAETREYVPLMIAAARIAKEPAKYGFDGVSL